jgi:WD40 repeat protein
MPEATFMARPDLPVPANGTMALCDRTLSIYVHATSDGKIEVREVGPGTLLASHDVSPRKIDSLLGLSDNGKFLAFRHDRTRLGMLHVDLGLTPFRAEPWPDPSQFRPCQVTFGTPRLSLIGTGGRVGAGIPMVSWPEPDGTIIVADPFFGYSLIKWPPPGAEQAAPGVGPQWQALRFSQDGYWLAAAHGPAQRVEIRHVLGAEGRAKCPMPAPVSSLGWAEWKRLGVGLADGSVHVVAPRPDADDTPIEFPTVQGHTRPVVNVVFGGPGIISSSEDGTTKFWDRRSPDTLLEFPAFGWRAEYDSGSRTTGPLLQGGVVGFVGFEPSNIYRTDGVWKHNEATGPHCVLPSGRGIALLHDEGIDFNGTARYGRRNLVALDATWCAAASPDSSWLLTGHTGTVRRLSIGWTDAQQNSVVPGKPATVLTDVKRAKSLALNASGDLLAVADAGAHEVRVHRLDRDGTAAGAAEARIPLANPMACALSPDGKWVAAGSSDPLAAGVWNAATGASVTTLDAALTNRNWRPVFSRDGRWLAMAGRTCQLVATGTWEPGPAFNLPPNGANYHGAAFHSEQEKPGRGLLAVIAADREVHLFLLVSGPPATVERIVILRSPGAPFVSFPAFDNYGNLTVALPRAMLATWFVSQARRQLRAMNLGW